MRFAFGLPALLLLSGPAWAGEPAFPEYDTAKICQAQAEYAYAATLGEARFDREQSACTLRERLSMVSAQALWLRVTDRDKAECLGLAEGRYGYLDRCLEGSRSLRAAR